MDVHQKGRGSLVLFATLAVIFWTVPMFTNALGSAANQECMPWNAACPCGAGINPPKCNTGGPNKANCPVGICQDKTQGHTTAGTCAAAGQCKGATGDGKGLGMDQLVKALGDLLGKLKGSEAGSGGSTPATPLTSTGCVGTTFQTSDITQLSNPCAVYVPISDTITPTTTDTGGCSILEQALGTCGETTPNPTPTDSDSTTPTSPASTPTPTSTAAGQTPRIISPPTLTSGFGGILGGERGDILLVDGGATVFVGSRDVQKNTEVAGFYGSGTLGGAPQGLVAQWCESRPWASNFLGKIVAPTFFDNLCKWRGYQVGTPSGSAPVLQQTVVKTKPPVATSTTPTTQGSSIPAKVDIWAVPATVPLGARTSIFWSTQGVTDCTETSAAGNFTQNSLSGGAATVPITTATEFTISCKTSDGSTVTDSVTVDLAI